MEILKLVVTGGPCGGKSNVIEAIEERLGDHLLVVPEAATLLLSGGFPPPGEIPDLEILWPFQRSVFQLIVEMEAAYAHLARQSGKRLLVCDRGRLDGGAYVPGLLPALMKEIGFDATQHARAYDRVVHLESLAVGDPEFYEEKRGRGNTIRMEGIEQAIDREHRVREVWESHPNRVIVPCGARAEGLTPKIDVVERIITEMLTA